MSELTLLLYPLIPEIVLVVGAMALLLLGVVRPETEREAERICWLALLVVGVALWRLIAQLPGKELLFDGGFVIDDFARFMKILTLIGSAGALFFPVALIQTKWALIAMLVVDAVLVVWMIVYSYVVYRDDPHRTPPAGTLPNAD